MKKVFVISLCIILGVFVYLFLDVKCENTLLNSEIEDLRFRWEEFNKKKEEYYNKEQQLSDLKEEKKNELLKYEEVSLWNEEINGYLD